MTLDGYVRIDVTGHDIFDRLGAVLESMESRYAIVSPLQMEWAETFFRVAPPALDLEGEEFPEYQRCIA